MTDEMNYTKADRVVTEIRARAEQGMSLASGDNRGDWLYAASVLCFGSWGKAVEAAGFDYDDVRHANHSPEWVLREIRKLAEAGDPLHPGEHKRLLSKARCRFGNWEKAVEAAGYSLAELRNRLAREKVKAQIRTDVDAGLAVTTMAVIRRNEALYGAGRRAFGNWQTALKVALGDEAPKPLKPRRGPGKKSKRRTKN